MRVLAGDVGGTKTVLALIDTARDQRSPLFEQLYPSAQFNSFEEVLQDFLQHIGDVRPEAVAVGVAGPVFNGEARITNLPWVIRESDLRMLVGVERVRVLNDLEAIANAIPSLHDEDVLALDDNTPEPGAPIGVIAPGTGLGEAFLLCWDGHYHAFPSEGGHADFAPNNELEADLLRYLQRKFGRASYERVCSGIGIPNVYRFLRDGAYIAESPQVAAELNNASDPTPVIVKHAMSDPADPLCLAVMDIFASVLAAKAGNLALTIIATGGIYLAGGMPLRILPLLLRESFLQTFRRKGRLTGLMQRVPLRVVTNPKVGLLGAVRAVS
ncbi:MAG: glucokinase [Thermoflexales bacterium]